MLTYRIRANDRFVKAMPCNDGTCVPLPYMSITVIAGIMLLCRFTKYVTAIFARDLAILLVVYVGKRSTIVAVGRLFSAATATF
jgi:hypothetical protein